MSILLFMFDVLSYILPLKPFEKSIPLTLRFERLQIQVEKSASLKSTTGKHTICFKHLQLFSGIFPKIITGGALMKCFPPPCILIFLKEIIY